VILAVKDGRQIFKPADVCRAVIGSVRTVVTVWNNLLPHTAWHGTVLIYEESGEEVSAKEAIWIATREEFAKAARISVRNLTTLTSDGKVNHLRVGGRINDKGRLVGARVLFEMPRHLEEYAQRFERRAENKRIKIVN